MRRVIAIMAALFVFFQARAGGYFEGWYFKLQSESQTMALIVAHHRTEGVHTASLQVITDDTVWNIPFDYEGYSRNGSKLDVRLGDNHFSPAGIHLDIHEEGIDLAGDIAFGPWTPLKGDIMGPFAAVPFMQCRHSVWSAEHMVNGAIFLNDTIYDFSNSKGYIEGDRGYSFPSVYIWTQSLFEDGSIMLSVADIPMGMFHFTGVIGFVYYKGKEYRLATYNGAKVIKTADNTAIVRCKDMELTARLVKKNAYPLYAPVNGAMSRVIRESATCVADYKFVVDGETLLDFTTDQASFEYEWE